MSYPAAPRGWFSVPITPMVRRIMIAASVVYAVQVLIALFAPDDLALQFAANTVLVSNVFETWKVWTLFTYGWLHEVGMNPHFDLAVCAVAAWGLVRLYKSAFAQREFVLFLLVGFLILTLVQVLGHGAPLHLAGNLLVLYFFGHDFETRWGGRRFLLFWSLCIIGGGVLNTLVAMAFPSLAGHIVVGASAGTMGLIAAFAVYFPDRTIAYGFVLPIKGKHMVLIAVGFDLIYLISGSPVAVFAHFGGILTGLALTTGYWRPTKIKRLIDKKRGSGPSDKPRHLRLVKDDQDDDEPPRYLH